MANSDLSEGISGREPKVLLLVGSAGIYPWTEIEERAQRSAVLSQQRFFHAGAIWFEGNSGKSPWRGWPLSVFLAWALKLRSQKRHRRWRSQAKFVVRGLEAIGFYTILDGYLRKLAVRIPDRKKLRISENRIRSSFSSNFHFAGLRTLEAFHHSLMSHDFDFLVRITSTCLPLGPNIFSVLANTRAQRIYGGQSLQFGEIQFVSGAMLVLSRDVVSEVWRNRLRWDFELNEDVALAKLIQDCEIAPITEFVRLDASTTDGGGLLLTPTGEALPLAVRCKAEWPATTEPRPVISLMHQVVLGNPTFQGMTGTTGS